MDNKKLFLITILVILGGVLFVNLSTTKQNTTVRTNANTPNTPTALPSDRETQSSYADGISLQVTAPKDKQTITTPSLTVTGKTSPGADVFVNDMELRANGSGNFSAQITLDEGENAIVIVTNDQEGNSAEKELIVTYQSK